jgi:putative DNA primase/helicase
MTSLRTTAAKYASLGYAIVPVHWIREDGSCSCNDWSCKKPGKHPINANGAADPIFDPEEATRQWDELPKANIGIVAGPTGWLIVDIDSDQARDYFRSIADYETIELMKHAPINKTGKGWHFIFRDDERQFGPSVGTGLDTGIDIRAGVSLFVAPPSIHVSGHQYAWMNCEPPFDPPQPTRWLVNYIRTRKEKPATIIEDGFRVDEGSRNATMTELGGSMRRRGFSEDEIGAALLKANQRINKPPLPDREIGSIAHSLASYAPSDVPASLEIASIATDDLIGRLHGLDTQHLVEDAPPIIEWVWDDYMAPGTLNMLHGDGGLGKSYLSLKIAEQMLRPEGGELFGKKIRPGGVVILDGENAEVQIHHRIHNTTIVATAPLKIFSVDQPILGYEEKTNALFAWLAAEYDPRLVIIDSQRALWAGDEKEQMEVGRMLRAFAKGLEEHPFATLLLHHDNRGKDYAGSSDMNAAISGARLHLEKHGTKDETQARRLSMPKNRIGPEMLPEQFFLSIETQPRSHRYQVSGIGIRAYESSTETMARDLLEQAKMKIINQSCTNDELFAAFGWEVENYRPRKNEHRELWDMIAVDLEHAGFARKREPGGGNRMLWKYIGEPTHSV